MMIGERQRMSRAVLFISRVQCYQFDSYMSTSSGLLSEFGIATARLPPRILFTSPNEAIL